MKDVDLERLIIEPVNVIHRNQVPSELKTHRLNECLLKNELKVQIKFERITNRNTKALIN